jgi:hypothetical protein
MYYGVRSCRDPCCGSVLSAMQVAEFVQVAHPSQALLERRAALGSGCPRCGGGAGEPVQESGRPVVSSGRTRWSNAAPCTPWPASRSPTAWTSHRLIERTYRSTATLAADACPNADVTNVDVSHSKGGNDGPSSSRALDTRLPSDFSDPFSYVDYGGRCRGASVVVDSYRTGGASDVFLVYRSRK